MPLDPALKSELEQRKADVHRRVLALEAWNNTLATSSSSIATDLQQIKTDAQGFTVPDEDPPNGAVDTLQDFEVRLHTAESGILAAI